MLYSVIRFFVKIAAYIFFKRIHIKNLESIPTNVPLIIAANHPNTLLDPVVIAVNLKQTIHFLAKSTLFKTSVHRWLMSKLNMIPIYRKQDVPVELQANNEAIFKKCFEFLAKGGSIMIFPEGISLIERRLREIKTGAARIALGAEAENNFGLNMAIVTIGLNYSAPEQFRSEVFINIHEPIFIKTYEELYKKNQHQAVEALTEQIRVNLEEQTIITKDDQEDELVKNIDKIYKNKLAQELHLADNDIEEDFMITKGFTDALHYFEEKNPLKIIDLKEKVTKYSHQLNHLQIEDSFLSERKKRQNILSLLLLSTFYLLIGFPLYVFGLISNYIPYILPSKVADAFVKEIEFRASVMFVTGIFSFTIYHGVQVLACQMFFHNIWITAAYAFFLPVSGFFTLFYWQKLESTAQYWRLFKLFFTKNAVIASLLKQRIEIIHWLESAKKEYLAYLQQK